MKNYRFHNGILKVWGPFEAETQEVELDKEEVENLITSLQLYLNSFSLEEMFKKCASNPSKLNHEALCLMLKLGDDYTDTIGIDINLPYDFDLCYDIKTLNDAIRNIYYNYDLQGICSMVLYYKLVHLFEEVV